MCKCGRKNCTGFILVHPEEFLDIPKIMEGQLKQNPNYTFDLMESQSSGEIFTKFIEIHVLK